MMNDRTFCETINEVSDTEHQAKIINDNSDSYYNVLIHPQNFDLPGKHEHFRTVCFRNAPPVNVEDGVSQG